MSNFPIGGQLIPGREQFLLVDDVVAVEDGAGLVPGEEHGDAFGDAGADQVARGGAPAVVEEAGRHPGGRAGGAPSRAPAPNRDAVAVEDERAVGVASGRRLIARWSCSKMLFKDWLGRWRQRPR